MTDNPPNRHTLAECVKGHVDNAYMNGRVDADTAGQMKEDVMAVVDTLDDAYGSAPDADHPGDMNVHEAAVYLSQHITEAAYVAAIDNPTASDLHSRLDRAIYPLLDAAD